MGAAIVIACPLRTYQQLGSDRVTEAQVANGLMQPIVVELKCEVFGGRFTNIRPQLFCIAINVSGFEQFLSQRHEILETQNMSRSGEVLHKLDVISALGSKRNPVWTLLSTQGEEM